MTVSHSILRRSCSVLLLLGILIIFEIVFFGSGYYFLDLQSRSNISSRLGIEPSWNSLEVNISEHITTGMTRIEVIHASESIGPFVIIPVITNIEYCEDFMFNVGPFHSARGGRWDVVTTKTIL